MNTVLVDASSAILLHKAALFEAMSHLYRLAMVATVVQEVTVAHRFGAADFKLALEAKRIHPIRLDVTSGDAACFSRALGAGERDTLLAFASSQARFILIDDGEGARACRSRHIPYINALLCPEILYGVGCLQRRQRDTAFKRLLAIGRYSPDVVAYADQCRGEALAYFYPQDGRPKEIPT